MLVVIQLEKMGFGCGPGREKALSLKPGFGDPTGLAKLPPLVASNLKGWRGLERRSITLAQASVAPR